MMKPFSTKKALLLLPALALLPLGCNSSGNAGASSTTLTKEEMAVLPESMKKNTSMSDADKKAYAREEMRYQVINGTRRAPGSQPQGQ